MAEAKPPQEKTDNKSDNTLKNKQKGLNPTFNTFDIFCVLFSLGTFVADLSTGEFATSIVFVLSVTGVIPTTRHRLRLFRFGKGYSAKGISLSILIFNCVCTPTINFF